MPGDEPTSRSTAPGAPAGPGQPDRAAPASDALEGLVSGAAWDAFCEHLKRVGEQVTRPEAPADPFNRAEGFRYLTRVLRSALDTFVEHADTDFPVIYRVCDEMIKYGGDNPDNCYQKCLVDGRRDYRIWGSRGTVAYLGFLTQGSNYAEGESMLPTGFLDGRDLQVNADGRFEIVVSRHEQPGNWLPMTERSQALLIRQTFLDRQAETLAELRIARLGAEGATPEPLDPLAFAQGMQTATQFLEGTVRLFCDWSQRYQQHSNTLPKEDQAMCQRVGGDPNICYYNSHWRLAPDQAWVVFLPRIPRCENWNLQVCNYWMESLDYRHHRIHVNKHTAHGNPDGSVHVVIAHQDPGHPNWLSTAGHGEGTVVFRWIGADEHIDPVTEIMPASRVAALPAAVKAPARPA